MSDTSTNEINNTRVIFDEIESIRVEDKIDYISAIVHYCDKYDIEIDHIATYIKDNIVFTEKIREEAEDLNFIEKTSRLPI